MHPEAFVANSKEIKLLFHANDLFTDINVEKITERNGVYQLQMIKVSGKQYSIFYKSRCGDFRQDMMIKNRYKCNRSTRAPKTGSGGGVSTNCRNVFPL